MFRFSFYVSGFAFTFPVQLLRFRFCLFVPWFYSCAVGASMYFLRAYGVTRLWKNVRKSVLFILILGMRMLFCLL